MSAAPAPRPGQPLYTAGTGVLFPVLSPEGVPLRFEIATAGARIGGVIVDYGILFVSILLLWLLLGWSGLLAGSSLVTALLMVATFLFLHFYFTFFEVRWQGSTPGKRLARTRVISRTGGPVTGDAIATRNFLRLVEIFVPLQMLQLWSSDSLEGVPWYLTLLGVLWAFLLLFLPLFNRQRMRLGDLAAGTVVVRVPKTVLLDDLGAVREDRRRAQVDRFTFTREQLAVYGEFELQVLEDVLRGEEMPDRERTLGLVTEKIVRKIGWDRPMLRRDTLPFLEAYYAALRAHRERRMLFGKRKQDKHSDEA